MKPCLKYKGGKSKELQQILQHIPNQFGTYIEPFCGGGAVYWALEPKAAILNDLNTKLMIFYLQVRHKYSRMERELRALNDEYIANNQKFNEDKIRLDGKKKAVNLNAQKFFLMRQLFNYPDETQYLQGTVYFYINHTAYGSMIRYNSMGEFNIPYGYYKTLGIDALTEEHSKLLQKADLYNVDYRFIFDMAEPDDFMFIDPPYNTSFSDFGNQDGAWSADKHKKLAEAYKNLECKALMIIGSTPLTDSLYKKYICGRYAITYSANIKNRFDHKAEHLIIKNY